MMGTDLSTIYQAKWWPWSVLIATNHGGQFYWWRKLEYPEKTTGKFFELKNKL
jgi:hypothetical protein